MKKIVKNILFILSIIIIQSLIVFYTIYMHDNVNINCMVDGYKTLINTLNFKNETKDIKILSLEKEIFDLKNTIRAINIKNEASKKQIVEQVEKLTAVKLKTEFVAAENRNNIAVIKSYITNNYNKVPIEIAELISKDIIQASRKYNVDFHIIVGVIEIESHFNPYAFSNVGARGLMQVMYKIWKSTYNITDSSLLHGISYNIDIGTQILKHYIDKNNGNLDKALRNYNGSKSSIYSDKVLNKIGKFMLFKAEHDV